MKLANSPSKRQRCSERQRCSKRKKCSEPTVSKYNNWSPDFHDMLEECLTGTQFMFMIQLIKEDRPLEEFAKHYYNKYEVRTVYEILFAYYMYANDLYIEYKGESYQSESFQGEPFPKNIPNLNQVLGLCIRNDKLHILTVKDLIEMYEQNKTTKFVDFVNSTSSANTFMYTSHTPIHTHPLNTPPTSILTPILTPTSTTPIPTHTHTIIH